MIEAFDGRESGTAMILGAKEVKSFAVRKLFGVGLLGAGHHDLLGSLV